MNRMAWIQLCTFGAAALLAGQCSQSGPASPVDDAATGLGGAPATGNGGSSGTGGTTGTGTGGRTTTATGGSSGTGGVTGGAGGSTTGAGGATTGAGGAAVSIASVVPALDGFYWEGTCSGTVTASGRNCPFSDDTVTTCPAGTSYANRGAFHNRTINVLGTPGVQYTINFEVRGVAGTRCYTGGTPASTAVPNANGPNNTWYVGGVQFNDSIWNTYEIHVSPPVTGEANVYYANGFPMNPDWCQKEATYEIRYTAQFKVLGGGTIRFTIHDANCQAQQNCGGNDTATVCDATRTIDLTGLSPAATFTQPVTNQIGAKTYYPQWLYFDVKSVTSP